MPANPNYTYLVEKVPKQRVTLLQGGTRSGKTRATIDYIIKTCLDYSGLEIDIVRDTFTSLRSTVYQEFEKVLRLYKVKYEHNKTEHIIIINNNMISFYGLDNDEKIHGRERDIIWINEVNQISQTVYDQIAPRTRHRIIADYNPRLGKKHWLDPLIKKYKPLITTYKDNVFLTQAQIDDIESKKDDLYWWSVYGCGERASREGAIFTNWEIGIFDESVPFIYGQDFGFHPDPTTLVKVGLDRKRKILYLSEKLYNNNHLSTDEIFTINRSHVKGQELIIADSAEPRLISELRNKGLNIIKAYKPSVALSVKKMLDYKIVIDSESHNLESELSNYVWSDKRAGLPIDKDNHLIDASRYAFLYLAGIRGGTGGAVGSDRLI